MRQWIDRARAPDYWRELCPELAIDGPAPAPLCDLDEAGRAELLSWLLAEGYYQREPLVPPALTAAMAAAVRAVRGQGLPAVFAFAYDAFWYPGVWFRPLLAVALGADYQLMPRVWAWLVDGTDDDGWPPHRDYADFSALMPNGLPGKMVVWIPLTDATPLNGCIYVLPAGRDPAYVTRDMTREDHRLEDVRALPAAAGSFLCWNSALLHWGGKPSGTARDHRISLSLEFQRGDLPPWQKPLFDPAAPPPFARRLALIGRQLLQYEHMYPLDGSYGALARALAAP